MSNAAVLDRLADPAQVAGPDPLLDIEKRAFIAGVAASSLRHAKVANLVGRAVGGALGALGKGLGGLNTLFNVGDTAGRLVGGAVAPVVGGAMRGAAKAVGSGVSSAASKIVSDPLTFAIGVPGLAYSVGKYTNSPYAPQQTVSGLSRSRTGA